MVANWGAVRIWGSTLLIGVLVAACGSAAETASTEGDAQSQVVAGQPSNAESSPTSETAEAEKPDAIVDLQVVDYGFTQLDGGEYGSPGVTYGVIVANNGSAIATDAQAQLTFKDAAGVVVDTVEDYISVVLPGSSVALGDFVYDADGVETMTVQILPGATEEVDGEPADFTVSDVTTREQEFGGLKTTATVNSPFTRDLEDLHAVAIYRDDAGNVIGGAFTFLGFVPAGGDAAVAIDSLADGLPTPAQTEVYIAISGLTMLADMANE